MAALVTNDCSKVEKLFYTSKLTLSHFVISSLLCSLPPRTSWENLTRRRGSPS